LVSPVQSSAEDSTAATDAKLFGGTPGSAEDEGNMPSAPAISDEVMIANSMEVAYQLYHAEDFQGAAQSCQQIVERYPRKDLLNVLYVMALSQEHNRAYNEALKIYGYIIKHQPKSTFANAAAFRVGLCHLAIGHVEEAIRTFRDIIDFNPKSEYRLQAFIHLGNVYRSQMAWQQCEVIYKDMIRLYPCSSWSATASQYLAEAYAHQGETDKAMRVYRLMQADNGCVSLVVRAQAQLRIADMQMADHDFQEALQTYKEAIRRYGDVPSIQIYAEERIDQAREGRSLNGQIEPRRRDVSVRKAMAE
jgi:pentatricopeptide repeat protein